MGNRFSLVDLKPETLVVNFFFSFKLLKIKRGANKVAHEIAKFCFGVQSDAMLVGFVPQCVVSCVTNDCNFLSSSYMGCFTKSTY